MLRTLFFLLLAGVIGFGVYKWGVGGIDPIPRPDGKSAEKTDHNKPPEQDPKEVSPEPQRSPRAEPLPVGDVQVTQIKDPARQFEPLIIPDARIGIIEFLDLGSQRNGKIVLLGIEQPANTPFDPKTMKQEKFSFLGIETSMEEVERLKVEGYRIKGDTRLWRRWREEDPIEPNRVKLMTETKTFLVLQENMPVEKDQLLGLIDPRLTNAEMDIKTAKLLSALSEVLATSKTKDEARTRYERLLKVDRAGGTSAEELSGAKLAWERFIEEQKGKEAALEVARREVLQTDTVLKLHEIRAPIAGVVRRMFKQSGESVKEQDSILRIENLNRLRVEALVDVQDAERLAEGLPVVVEPTKPESPAAVLRGHREALTAVAVTRAPQSWIISASEDRTMRVWGVRREKGTGTKDAWIGEELYRLDYPSVIRSLACTTKDSGKNLCLSGSMDGHAWLWDLDQVDKSKPVELKDAHRGPIFAVAFSADGKWCATGGDDRAIGLWNTETGEQVQRIQSAHNGSVTSLAFTPAGQLVSAGKDYRLVVWSVRDGKAEFVRDIPQRAGTVEQLGVNKDGTQVLFDQGGQVRVLNLADWSIKGVVRNPSASMNFGTFAYFGPDSKTILTAGATDNRLQLWTNPVDSQRRRAVELRQYVWNDGPSLCAAFDPQGSFAVTGTRDRHVLVWQMPPIEEVREPDANAVITSIVKVFDNQSRQWRVIADVTRKTDRLVPGDKANLVVYPK